MSLTSEYKVQLESTLSRLQYELRDERIELALSIDFGTPLEGHTVRIQELEDQVSAVKAKLAL